jgi:hypothetical protein
MNRPVPAGARFVALAVAISGNKVNGFSSTKVEQVHCGPAVWHAFDIAVVPDGLPPFQGV